MDMQYKVHCFKCEQVSADEHKYKSVHFPCISCKRKNNQVAIVKPKAQCIICGVEISESKIIYRTGIVAYRKAKKYCDSCRKQIIKKGRRESYLKWYPLNAYKARVSSRARYHKNDLIILYECPCPGNSKHYHHPDYSKPLEVIRLCHKCHRLEHKRLRILGMAQ